MAAPTHECFRAAFTQEPNQTIQPKQALSKALVTSQEPSALRVLKHKKPSDKRISIPTNPAKPDSYSTIEHKVAAVMGSPQATTTPASKDQISQSVTTPINAYPFSFTVVKLLRNMCARQQNRNDNYSRSGILI